MKQHIEVENGSVDALVGQAANEFIEELQRGGDPQIEAYVGRYPEVGSTLREVLGVLAALSPARDESWHAGNGEANGHAGLESGPAMGRLGDFHVLREIGRGGMGVVYEAEQLSLGRRVALKVLPAAAAMDAKRLQRFHNEAQAAAHLHHQNIVPVHAVGQLGNMHYYAMQYIEGQTLAAIIRDLRHMSTRDARARFCVATSGAAPREDAPCAAGADVKTSPEATTPFVAELATPADVEPESSPPHSSGLPSDSSAHGREFFRAVAKLGAQAADALEHAHSMGIVHRDIKPGNLLLDGRGNLWITDFGLAHFQGDTQLTMTGDIVGTLRYMSPEQALGQRGLLDQRTDVYSLGMTLYELATLEPAFDGESRQALLHQIACAEPVPPRRVNRSIPRDLETIILKGISKDPHGRYATAQQMADDLRRFLADEPIQARRPTPLQKAAKWCRRQRAVVSTAIGVAILGLVATALVAWVNKTREQALHHLAERKLDLAWAAVNDMYLQGEKLLQYEPHKEEVRKGFLDKALTFYREFVAEPAADRDGRFRKAQAFHRIADIRCGQGSPAEANWFGDAKVAAQAWQSSREALEESMSASAEAVLELEQLLAEFPDTPVYGSELAETHMTRGRVLGQLGQAKKAEEAYGLAAARFERLAAGAADPREPLARLASCECRIADFHTQPTPRDFDTRGKALARAREILEGLINRDEGNAEWLNRLASVEQQRGGLLLQMGQRKQAETVLRDAARRLDGLAVAYQLLPESNFDLHRTYYGLGQIYLMAGKLKEAEDAFQRALEAGEKLVASNPSVPRYHAGLADALHGLAQLRYGRKDLKGAQTLAEQAVRHLHIAHEAVRDNLTYRFCIQGYSYLLGRVLLEAGDYRRAADSARWVSDIVPGCPMGAKNAAMLYGACIDAAAMDAQLSERERTALTQRFASDVPRLLDVAIKNGLGMGELGNDAAWLLATFPTERVRDPKRAVQVAERLVKGDGKTPCIRGEYWNTLGVARYRAGDWQGAVKALEQAAKLNKGKDASDWLFLAMAHWQAGNRDRSRACYERAQGRLKTAPATPELKRFRLEAERLLGRSAAPAGAVLAGVGRP